MSFLHLLITGNVHPVMEILGRWLVEFRSVSIRAEEGAPAHTTTSAMLNRSHPQEPQPLRFIVVKLQETKIRSQRSIEKPYNKRQSVALLVLHEMQLMFRNGQRGCGLYNYRAQRQRANLEPSLHRFVFPSVCRGRRTARRRIH